MNYMLNTVDNLRFIGKSYEFIPQNIKDEMNIDGVILNSGSKFLKDGKDIMQLVKLSGLQGQIGKLEYDALMRKPMFVFLLASSGYDIKGTKIDLDNRYGVLCINFNNFVQAFSLGCWLIKDSCIASTNMYWHNLFNKYTSKLKRDMPVTLSTGDIREISLDNREMKQVIENMYKVLMYLSPNESKMGEINSQINNGTKVWEIDKAISTEGNSFSKALILLQEARRTGVLATKVEKYCSMLECLYSINKNHKKNIKNITAVYIGKDECEMEQIRINMHEIYSIRSDGTHGDNLKYLEKNSFRGLRKLVHILDEYVREVFNKVLEEPKLNYVSSSNEKLKVRSYFMKMAKERYPNDYMKD
ncbi:hypothetical protein [Clostridium butyricum]|uniref:hypothetical protein n=1 Tax=Clostridium butyricum TaxID=1492 RepID=UPI00374E60EF